MDTCIALCSPRSWTEAQASLLECSWAWWCPSAWNPILAPGRWSSAHSSTWWWWWCQTKISNKICKPKMLNQLGMKFRNSHEAKEKACRNWVGEWNREGLMQSWHRGQERERLKERRGKPWRRRERRWIEVGETLEMVGEGEGEWEGEGDDGPEGPRWTTARLAPTGHWLMRK